MKISPLLIVFLALAGCSGPSTTKPTVPDTREGRLSGTWLGTRLTPGKNDTSSKMLDESLGGYTVQLRPDGTFDLDWRKLTKSGTWKIEAETVKLQVVTVLGKKRGEIKSDEPFFESDTTLILDNKDKRLILRASDKESSDLSFTKSPSG